MTNFRSDRIQALSGHLMPRTDEGIWRAIESLPLDAVLSDVEPQAGLLPHLAKSFMMPVRRAPAPAPGLEPQFHVNAALSVRLKAARQALGGAERIIEQVAGANPSAQLQHILNLSRRAHSFTGYDGETILLAAAILLPRRVMTLDYGTSGGRRVKEAQVRPDANVVAEYRRLVRELVAFNQEEAPEPSPASELPTHNFWVLRAPDLLNPHHQWYPEYLYGPVSPAGVYDTTGGEMTDDQVQTMIRVWAGRPEGEFLAAMQRAAPRPNDRQRLRYYAWYIKYLRDTVARLPDRPMVVVTRNVTPRGILFNPAEVVAGLLGKPMKPLWLSKKSLSRSDSGVKELAVLIG